MGRDFGVYRAQSRNFDEADPILEPTVEISKLSTPVVTKTSGNTNLRFPKSFGDQNVPFLNNFSNSVHPTNLKPTMEISELPPSLSQTPGYGNSRFSETFANQNQPFSQTSGNLVLPQENENVEIPQLAQTSGNGNLIFSQTFKNQNLPFSLTSNKKNLPLSQASGNGNDNEDYLIAAAAHYEFGRL